MLPLGPSVLGGVTGTVGPLGTLSPQELTLFSDPINPSYQQPLLPCRMSLHGTPALGN